jgi:hypothetical protein
LTVLAIWRGSAPCDIREETQLAGKCVLPIGFIFDVSVNLNLSGDAVEIRTPLEGFDWQRLGDAFRLLLTVSKLSRAP